MVLKRFKPVHKFSNENQDYHSFPETLPDGFSLGKKRGRIVTLDKGPGGRGGGAGKLPLISSGGNISHISFFQRALV